MTDVALGAGNSSELDKEASTFMRSDRPKRRWLSLYATGFSKLHQRRIYLLAKYTLSFSWIFIFTCSLWNLSVISVKFWIFQLSPGAAIYCPQNLQETFPFRGQVHVSELSCRIVNTIWPVIVIWLSMGTSGSLTSQVVQQQALIPVEKCLFFCGSEALCLHVRLDVLEVIFSSTGVI